MATTAYPLVKTWSSSARYTATGSTDIRISNPNDNTAIFWTITTSDTTPAIDPAKSNKLFPGEKETITLALNDRLWSAGSNGFSVVEV